MSDLDSICLRHFGEKFNELDVFTKDVIIKSVEKGEVKAGKILPASVSEPAKRDVPTVGVNRSKRVLLILLVLFWPAGLVYYFVKREQVDSAHENSWFLEHPFKSWLIIYAILFLLYVLSPSS